MRTRASLSILALSAIGCGSSAAPRSEDLALDEIQLIFSAASNGAVTQILVSPQDARFGSIELTGGDQLRYAASGGPEVALVEIGGAYVGQTDAPGLDFAITFARPSGDRATSTFTLPPPFAMSVPLVDAPRSTPIPVVWDAVDPAYSVSISISGPCISTLTRTLDPDPGSFTIQPADLYVIAAGACDVDVAVARRGHAVAYAPALAPPASLPVLEQVREGTITTVP